MTSTAFFGFNDIYNLSLLERQGIKEQKF